MLLKYYSGLNIQMICSGAFLLDPFGYFNYKFNRIFAFLISLLLIDISYLLIYFD